MAISSMSELREAYRPPAARAHQKVLDRLDGHARRFIELSPLCIISSIGADGRADTSPRGDPPGFVAVIDQQTLLIPDRPGNRQVDTLQNVLFNPAVGLLFLVPGMNETLRVAGAATIVTDADELAPMSIKNRPPLSGLRVSVEEVFLHCGRSLIRSRLWDPDARIDRSAYPTYGQVLADQINGADAVEIDASEDEANRERLY
ncbi:MAG: pyridoxamine 5'-phosphate oxidase family protein [Acidimicrobiales bacterium]|nr:pyridoxamine 5'-phosphate oxidase family protein [Acidimicrobiaceae bacterium]MXY04095.1 pyridoxamine 5'-phosphate oxidase family protein [Acidimicrobiales bacterium]MCY3609642.1 pyridoxamine 5'-phosphate oxidase family protein [Acidimicrobiaceae bacterium]MDE0676026.1 pyridoxamine 5'-phosphate oxidase family protein [Acidimicrobiaceae bacterium]MXZ15962.1 pyridoxamine 5'-phosphate oxidase family protein [Acidimicrobiales bacterium]